MRGKSFAFGVVGLLGLVLLAGCTSSSGSGSADRAAGGAVAGPAGAAARAPAAAAPASTPPATTTDLTSRAVIRTAELHVAVTRSADVTTRADQAESIVIADGGQVDSDNRTSGSYATAALTLEVPPASLSVVVNSLARLGHETSRTSSTQDVTTEVADVSSRVTSARRALTQLQALFARASKVSDVIAIESDIAQRESDLESLEAQQRALAARTTLATVRLDLSTAAKKPVVAAEHHREGGFLGGVRDGWKAFASTVIAVATGLVAALPFLAVVAILAWLGVLLRRRTRPPRSSVTDAAATDGSVTGAS